MNEPCLVSGQKAVIMTDEAWNKITRYLHDRLKELPEEIRTILCVMIVQTTDVTGD